MQALALYQHFSMYILPLLGILWGFVYAQYRQASRFTPAYVREALIIATVGRPVWKRAYQHLVF